MYTQFFRLTQAPFSISPDPRYLFMSDRHREALAHLLYGVDSGGGIVLLTGDIGTGKTTICRCFLEQVPANCNVAYIFNPKLTVIELLQTICEEFHVPLDASEKTSAKACIDALNRYLLAAHGEGRNNVLIIDEAQNLSAEVLEQLRLLTNLETNDRKLLQIILIGQPELRVMLSRPDLEQLAQRVIAHYHLTALSEQETASYIQHRLSTGGLTSASPFQPPLMKRIHDLTDGVPRRINLLCDRALLGAYAKGKPAIDRNILDEAAGELFINQRRAPSSKNGRQVATFAAIAGIAALVTVAWTISFVSPSKKHAQASATANAKQEGVPRAVADDGKKSPSATEKKSAISEAPVPDAPPQSAAAAQGGILRAGLRDEDAAVAQLMRLWGLPAAASEPCEAAVQANLQCHKGKGGFAELRRLDRPAVLVLYDKAGKPFHVLLTAIGDTTASLRSGDLNQEISLVDLARQFRGEFILLWRAPPGFSKAVKLDDTGAGVDWIATQLAKLNGAPPPITGQPFSRTSVKQLRQFQQAQGLAVDGVVGPATVMHLNRLAGVDEPQLHAGTSAARASATSSE